MFRIFKILIFFIALVLSNNVNAKPIPPGAGDGDVPANILFLVDSSASMGRWIGTDGLGRATGVAYDSQGRILISQNIRRSIGSVIRYTADGERDTTFRPIRRIPNTGCSQETDRNRAISGRNFRAASTVKFVEGLSSTVINNENIIFANSRERRFNNFIFGFSENGTTCRFALGTPGGSVIHDFDIKIINGTPHMFVIGRGWRARSSFFKSCDLSTMQCNTQTLDRNHIARFSNRMSVNNEGTIVYISDNRTGNLVGHTLTPMGSTYEIGAETRRCTSVNDPELTSQVMSATAVEVSPENSNIVYITSHLSHALQKLQLTDTDCTVVTSIGLGAASNARNSGDPNTLAAGDVNFNTPWGFHVTSTRVLVATHRGFVDEFDEDLFTVAGRDTAWLQQMGGPRVRRWDGVKEALNAILNDTTLTTGAHFGFGHWNAGENQGRRGPRGGQYCHRNSDCNYYGGWGGFTSANIGQTQTTETENADGTTTTTTTNLQTDTGSQLASNAHPNGTSTLCHVDACINVAVSSSGAGKIMDVFNPLGMAWGTDSHAFSQMAEEYFNDTNAGAQILDPDSDCQLNYIIVIGDGAMTNTGVLGAGGQTAARMQRLREKGVKSLYVAYGGGITGDNLQRFHELARIGSSTLTAATAQECIDDDECERAIVALTPEDLKTALTAKIRQIIADRLAFTAPSITATIEEGGSLYQAQFSYEQFGEWQGTILRKGIDAKGEVTHLITDPGNWSAAAQIKGQSTRGSTADTRYIWSAIPGVPYGDGIPDNFNTDNSTAIRGLFETLGYSIQDYHNASSDCDDIGNNSILGDEVNGLL